MLSRVNRNVQRHIQMFCLHKQRETTNYLLLHKSLVTYWKCSNIAKAPIFLTSDRNI